MKTGISASLFILLVNFVSAQMPAKKILQTRRTAEVITIDGHLNEPSWLTTEAAVDFIEIKPNPGKVADNQTRVRLLYDDTALYIAAELDEKNMAGLGTELLERDQLGDSRKLDWFAFIIDCYAKGLQGYGFVVSAAGVQTDLKFNGDEDDPTWDAVWDSEVVIRENGWVVEMKIPYSALRFPKVEVQEWGINFGRRAHQRQDESWWNEVKPELDGLITQTGLLRGIENIKPPLRLSATPFFAVYAENNMNPSLSTKSNWGTSYNGGMDIKYGISESYTLDMTLIPDFGQVQSDNEVLNLSPFEVQFSENRQFFTEGTELFNRAQLFYSRRIGGEPYYLEQLFSELQHNEIIEEVRGDTRLLNATKISGRSNGGTGLGFFNAISPRDHAIIKNVETDKSYSRLVQPFTNYNVMVIDQSLNNNSYVSVVNTNVWREGSAHDANVTGVEFDLRNKENKYGIEGSGAFTHKNTPGPGNTGFRYGLSFAKHTGNLTWDLGYYIESDTYDPNDLGFLYNNNEKLLSGAGTYNIYKPFGPFLDASIGINGSLSSLYKYPGDPASQVRDNLYSGGGFEVWTFGRFKNFMQLNIWLYTQPAAAHDYFEPRMPGRFFTYPAYKNTGIFYSSDTRKRVIISGHVRWTKFHEKTKHQFGFFVNGSYRVNDRLSFNYEVQRQFYRLDRGYITEIEDEIVFGARDFKDVTQLFSFKYNFSPRMSLNFRLRHNWTRVKYTHFYTLEEDGSITDRDYNENEDLNFNAWTIDTNFRWRFAPGSDIFVVWKNAVYGLDRTSDISFGENLNHLFDNPQTNSFSIKAIYYLDLQKL